MRVSVRGESIQHARTHARLRKNERCPRSILVASTPSSSARSRLSALANICNRASHCSPSPYSASLSATKIILCFLVICVLSARVRGSAQTTITDTQGQGQGAAGLALSVAACVTANSNLPFTQVAKRTPICVSNLKKTHGNGQLLKPQPLHQQIRERRRFSSWYSRSSLHAPSHPRSAG